MTTPSKAESVTTMPKPEDMKTPPKAPQIQVSEEEIASIEAATKDKETKDGGLR